MSNKEMTAVEYLVEQLIPKALSAEQYYHIQLALQMEALKQQKYDEMLAMLKSILKISDAGYVEAYEGDFGAWETELNVQMEKARQLLKEAKEL